jgi:hypothetical protein
MWFIGGGIAAVAAVGVLLLVLVGLWAAGVFKVKTKDGTIVLENLPDDAEVVVDGAKVSVTWADGGKRAEIRVKPGTREIVATKGGHQGHWRKSGNRGRRGQGGYGATGTTGERPSPETSAA